MEKQLYEEFMALYDAVINKDGHMVNTVGRENCKKLIECCQTINRECHVIDNAIYTYFGDTNTGFINLDNIISFKNAVVDSMTSSSVSD